VRRRWLVSYIAGSGWPVLRYFPTRPRAWAFYQKLLRRPRPPFEQSIQQEVFPIRFEDVKLLGVDKENKYWTVRLRVAHRQRPVKAMVDVHFEYDDLRESLKEPFGFELPQKHPGKRAWNKFFVGRGR